MVLVSVDVREKKKEKEKRKEKSVHLITGVPLITNSTTGSI